MATAARRLSDDGGTTTTMTFAERHPRDAFRDCALIEIIHLHDCLRGAIRALEHDVTALNQAFAKTKTNDTEGTPLDEAVVADLEGRVSGRFKVIWSVFRAHSTAEDDFIWPALRRKQLQQMEQADEAAAAAEASTSNKIPPDDDENDIKESSNPGQHSPNHRHHHDHYDNNLVQEEYEEDHADEERMFSEMDSLLKSLKEKLNQTDLRNLSPGAEPFPLVNRLLKQTELLSNHLYRHLEKEEVHCMPLVLKFLDKAEIHELVGEIMGRRSADTIAHIMTMAVQALPDEERLQMIKYMKQSMKNTFFDKWLLASGWGSSSQTDPPGGSLVPVASATRSVEPLAASEEADAALAEAVSLFEGQNSSSNEPEPDRKRAAIGEPRAMTEKRARGTPEITTQTELERLIRAIASNPALSAEQKNTTIQGLRDSVWKKNQQERLKSNGKESPPAVPVNGPVSSMVPLLSCKETDSVPPVAAAASTGVVRTGPTGQTRSLPPAKYYKRNEQGSIELVFPNNSGSSMRLPVGSVPTFSASELAPTYHDGVAGAVFGCPHYSRACKLRHPKSGKLYTCRLCCDHQRELPMREDEPLDRYAVTEICCMVCNTLQPANDRCINPDCTSYAHKPFARYFCKICHLYDDGSRPIYHCPFCNVCKIGHGLGVDFRHCMRCNCCVALSDREHRCLPQKLQGDCPICHEDLFQSTDPLRGLKCGHVMHLSCYTQYRRNRYTCPLCCKSMEDMKDHFALLDAAIRMQPMPLTFQHTMSNIYCQDCSKTGQVPFHFVGLKCPDCSSYNTREMGRVHMT